MRAVGIESDTGFEIGIELVAKARRLRLPVAEIPTIWLDRAFGASNFQLAAWLPRYLRWYRYAFGPRLDRSTQLRGTHPRRRRRTHDAKVLVTGSSGFIGGYVVEELLGRGYDVVGLDNHSKYGKVAKRYDDHPDYRLVEGDARDVELMTDLLMDCDHFIAGAAMIGGICYFHTYAYDLLATNERIMAVVLRRRHRGPSRRAAAEGHLPELVDGLRVDRPLAVVEGEERRSRRRSRPTGSRSWRSSTSPGPRGTSTGCRTRSSGRSTASASARCGRWATSRSLSGNVKLAMSHVVPDLVQKVLKGQDPLHILGDGSQIRHYTYGGDLARGHRHRHGAPGRAATRTSTSRPPSPRPCSSWPS